MASPQLLSSDDLCHRLAFLEQRWQPPAIRPVEALHDAVEAGLQDTSDADPAEVASEHFMEAATVRGLDSNQADILAQAENLAGLAHFITWILRTGKAWKRPEPITLPNGTPWNPAAFLDPTETRLRRIVLCNRWDAYRQVEEEHSWRTLEAAIYGVPMDLIVIVLGQDRDGRRHGPLSKGWTHPVSKTLRFRKRDGGGFDASWQPVFREQEKFTREQWLDALAEDGLLAECVLIHQVQNSGLGIDVPHLAEAKLSRIAQTRTPLEPQLSRCFDRFRPCPFRSCCPNGVEPTEKLGFIRVAPAPLRLLPAR